MQYFTSIIGAKKRLTCSTRRTWSDSWNWTCHSSFSPSNIQPVWTGCPPASSRLLCCQRWCLNLPPSCCQQKSCWRRPETRWSGGGYWLSAGCRSSGTSSPPRTQAASASCCPDKGFCTACTSYPCTSTDSYWSQRPLYAPSLLCQSLHQPDWNPGRTLHPGTLGVCLACTTGSFAERATPRSRRRREHSTGACWRLDPNWRLILKVKFALWWVKRQHWLSPIL